MRLKNVFAAALLASLAGLGRCQTAIDCALGDMGEGCNWWGWEQFYQYDDAAAGPSTIVAVGDNGVVITGTDGLTWTESLIQSSNNNFRKVIHTGTRFVAVGGNTSSTNEIIYTSTDGLSWTAATISSPCTTSADLRDVVQLNGRLVAVGTATAVTQACVQFSTDDGLTWSAGTSSVANVPLLNVIAFGSDYIAGATSGAALLDVRAYRSTDGSDFATEVPGSGDPLDTGGAGKADNSYGIMEAVDVNGTALVVLAGTNENSSATSDALSAYLTSGLTWTFNSTAIFGGNTSGDLPLAMAYGNSTLIALGNNCGIDSTADTANLAWTGSFNTVTGCSTNSFRDVVFVSNKFIAVGDNGMVAVSSTGGSSDWTLSTVGSSGIHSIAHN